MKHDEDPFPPAFYYHSGCREPLGVKVQCMAEHELQAMLLCAQLMVQICGVEYKHISICDPDSENMVLSLRPQMFADQTTLQSAGQLLKGLNTRRRAAIIQSHSFLYTSHSFTVKKTLTQIEKSVNSDKTCQPCH